MRINYFEVAFNEQKEKMEECYRKKESVQKYMFKLATNRDSWMFNPLGLLKVLWNVFLDYPGKKGGDNMVP